VLCCSCCCCWCQVRRLLQRDPALRPTPRQLLAERLFQARGVTTTQVREELGSHGVFKRLRRTGHQFIVGTASSSARGVTPVSRNPGTLVSVCEVWHATQVTGTPACRLVHLVALPRAALYRSSPT
jgi:hypothetical protein